MQPGCKQWPSRTRELLGDDARTCNIPALKNGAGEWITSAKGKADELADTFAAKNQLGEQECNRFSRLKPSAEMQWSLLVPTTEMAERTMSTLDESSGTGGCDGEDA